MGIAGSHSEKVRSARIRCSAVRTELQIGGWRSQTNVAVALQRTMVYHKGRIRDRGSHWIAVLESPQGSAPCTCTFTSLSWVHRQIIKITVQRLGIFPRKWIGIGESGLRILPRMRRRRNLRETERERLGRRWLIGWGENKGNQWEESCRKRISEAQHTGSNTFAHLHLPAHHGFLSQRRKWLGSPTFMRILRPRSIATCKLRNALSQSHCVCCWSWDSLDFRLRWYICFGP